MTNQQGAPEALTAAQIIARFEREDGYRLEGAVPREWALEAYNELRRLAALVEAQQPAPSAAAATEVENLRKALQFYADKEHFTIADDGAWDTVSGEPQNYWCDEEGTATVEDGTIARLALAGHQIKFEADAAPQPSPTPQADSQPAPVRGYPPLPARRRAFLCTKCGGHECEPGTLNETHPTCKCGYLGFAEDLDFTADDMRAYVDADRAASATADSVTAPAGGWHPFPHYLQNPDGRLLRTSADLLERHGYTGCSTPLRRMADALLNEPAAPTPPAQAADSVLEDAARLEQIAEAIRDYHYALDMRKHGGLAESAAFSSICNTMGMHWNRGEEAARRAAREQGGA